MLRSSASPRLLFLSGTFRDSATLSIQLPGRDLWPVSPFFTSIWRTSMHSMLSHSPESAHLAGRSSIRSKSSCWSASMKSISSTLKQSMISTLHLAPSRLPAMGAQTAVAGTNRVVPVARQSLLHTSLQRPHLSRCCTIAAERALPASSARPAKDEAPFQAHAIEAGPLIDSASSSPSHMTSPPARSPLSTALPSFTDPAAATPSPPTAAPEPTPAPPLHAPALTAGEAPNPTPSATPHTSSTCSPLAPPASSPAASNPTPSAVPHTSSTCPPPASPASSPAASDTMPSAMPHTSSTCSPPASPVSSSPAASDTMPSAMPHTSSTCPPPASPASLPAASDPTPPTIPHTSSTCSPPASSPAASDPTASAIPHTSSTCSPPASPPAAPELPAASVGGGQSEPKQGEPRGNMSEGGSEGQLSPSAHVHGDEEGAQPAAAAAAATAATEATAAAAATAATEATAAAAAAATAAGPTVEPSAPTSSLDPQGTTGQHIGSTSASRTASPSNFASLPQAAPTRVVVVGVDPDTNGALAVASWLSYDLNEKVDLNRAQWQMYDVPVAVVELLTKTKDGKSRRRRWLDIIAARKIILQIVQRFNGDSPAYARAVNQTSYVTHSSPWVAQGCLETQQDSKHRPPPPQQDQQQQQQQQQQRRQQNLPQQQEKHIAGSSSSSSSSSSGSAGTAGLAKEDVSHSMLLARGPTGGQAAHAGPETGSIAEQAEEVAAHGSGMSPRGSAGGRAVSANPEAGSMAEQAKEAAAHGTGVLLSGCADGQAEGADPEAGTTGRSADAAAPAHVRVDMRAFVEAPPIIYNSCSPRTMAQQLYAVGVWYGLLSMAGFQTATVNVRHWKGDLGLRGLDKNDSRLLARQLVPSKTSVLERKKDHGRAEALLIAAWAMGCTRPIPMNNKKTRKAAAASASAARAGVPTATPAPSTTSSIDSATAPSLPYGAAAASISSGSMSSSRNSNGEDTCAGSLQPIPCYPAYAINSDGAVVSLSKGLKTLKVMNGRVKIKDEHGAQVRVRVEELISKSRSAGGRGPSDSPSPALGLNSSINPGPNASTAEASGGEVAESRPSQLGRTLCLDSLNNQDSPDSQNSNPQHHHEPCYQPSSAELVDDGGSSSSVGSGSTSMANTPAVSGSNPVPCHDSNILDGSTSGTAPTADPSPSVVSSGSSRAQGLAKPSSEGAGGVSTAEEELPSHLSLPVCMGPVRSLTSTDGYGNALPYADFDADFTIPEVQAKVPKPKGSKSRKGGRPAAATSVESSSSREGSRLLVRDSHIAEFLGLLGDSNEEEDEGEEGKEEGLQGPGITHTHRAETPLQPKKRSRRKKGVRDGGDGSMGGQMVQGEGSGAKPEAVGCGHRERKAGVAHNSELRIQSSEEQVRKGRRKRGSGAIISGNEVSSIGGVSNMGGSISEVTSTSDSQASSSSGVPSSLTSSKAHKEQEASSPGNPTCPQEPVASSSGDADRSAGSSRPRRKTEKDRAAQDAPTISTGTLHYPPASPQPTPGASVSVLQPPPLPSPPRTSGATVSGETIWSVTQHAPVPYPQPMPGAAAWSVFQHAPVHPEHGADVQQRERVAHSMRAVMQLDEQAVALESSRSNWGGEAPRSTSTQHTSFHSHNMHPGTAQATFPQLQAFSTATGAVAHLDSDAASIMDRESEEGEREGRTEEGIELR